MMSAHGSAHGGAWRLKNNIQHDRPYEVVPVPSGAGMQKVEIVWHGMIPVADLGPATSPTTISGPSGGDNSSHPSGETPPNMMQLNSRVDALDCLS